MKLARVWQLARCLATCLLVPILGIPVSLPGQTHVVSPLELRHQLAAASSERQHNLAILTNLLSSPRVEKALGSAGIDPVQVKIAVSSLSDQELARLAARADKAQADFAAGTMSQRDLLIILIGL